MRVFVYEYMTATGTGREPGSPDHGMYLEGRAMRDAIAEDFARIQRVEAYRRFQTMPHQLRGYRFRKMSRCFRPRRVWRNDRSPGNDDETLVADTAA